MSITIDSQMIGKIVVVIFAIIGLLMLGGMALNGFMTSHATTTAAPVATPVPTQEPAQTTVIIQQPVYPQPLTFVVLSTTMSNGRYAAVTTSGNLLYVPNYATWAMMYPENTYTATIIGQENGAYVITNVVQLTSIYEQNMMFQTYHYTVYDHVPAPAPQYHEYDRVIIRNPPYDQPIRRDSPRYDPPRNFR